VLVCALKAQAFFVAGCNAVSSEEATLPVPQDEAVSMDSDVPRRTARRVEAARQLGQEKFEDLVARIEHAHDLVCIITSFTTSSIWPGTV
jgi:hypothetical protein